MRATLRKTRQSFDRVVDPLGHVVGLGGRVVFSDLGVPFFRIAHGIFGEQDVGAHSGGRLARRAVGAQAADSVIRRHHPAFFDLPGPEREDLQQRQRFLRLAPCRKPPLERRRSAQRWPARRRRNGDPKALRAWRCAGSTYGVRRGRKPLIRYARASSERETASASAATAASASATCAAATPNAPSRSATIPNATVSSA